MSTKAGVSSFQRRFGRGLAILLPSILTLWLLWQIGLFVLGNVAGPINALIRTGVIRGVPLVVDEGNLPTWFKKSPQEIQEYVRVHNDRPGGIDIGVPDPATGRWRLSPHEEEYVLAQLRHRTLQDYWKRYWFVEATGLLVAIILIYIAGLLLGNFIGRKVYERLERIVSAVPGFKQIYPHVKQVVDLVLGEKKLAFNQVVIVEYPGPGIWSIGFLTGDSSRQIDGPAGGRVRTVFVPNSPTPFTGFTVNIREDRIIELDMTVDQALRFVITAGVLTPDNVPLESDRRRASANGRSRRPRGEPAALGVAASVPSDGDAASGAASDEPGRSGG